MTNLIEPVLSLQDAASYKNLFERVGFKTLPEKDFSQYQGFLKRTKQPLIDHNRETIIVTFKIQAAKSGFLSFLKDVAIDIDDVSLYWFSEREKNGKYRYRCNDGEIIITNARIILLTYKPKTAEPDKIYSDRFNYLKIHNVAYEESILVLKTRLTHDICLNFKFPESSPLTTLASLDFGDTTANDRMRTMRNRQSITEYKDKAVNAKNIIYQFFLAVRESSQTTPKLNTPSQETQEITNLIKKLNELKEAGILTDVEFQEKKKDLLNRL